MMHHSKSDLLPTFLLVGYNDLLKAASLWAYVNVRARKKERKDGHFAQLGTIVAHACQPRLSARSGL